MPTEQKGFTDCARGDRCRVPCYSGFLCGNSVPAGAGDGVSMRRRPMFNGGFTLLELMMTVAIIAIVSSLAYPSYMKLVARNNRAAAQAVLMDIASRQQSYLLDARAYAESLDDLGVAVPGNVTAHFTISLDTDNTAAPPTFTVSASASAVQSDRDEDCASLSVDAAGTRTPATGCW